MRRSGFYEVFGSRRRPFEQWQGNYGQGTQHTRRQANQQTIHSNCPLFPLLAILCHKNYVGRHFLEPLPQSDLE